MLKDSPFYYLSIDLDDNKRLITEKASDAVFEFDEVLIQKDVDRLCSPIKRLECEIRWLPDFSEEQITQICAILRVDRKIPASYAYSQNSISGLNVLLESLPDYYRSDDIARCIVRVCGILENLDVESLLDSINYHRENANMAEASLFDLNEALNSYRSEIRGMIESKCASFLGSRTMYFSIRAEALKQNVDFAYGFLSDLMKLIGSEPLEIIDKRRGSFIKLINNILNNDEPKYSHKDLLSEFKAWFEVSEELHSTFSEDDDEMAPFFGLLAYTTWAGRRSSTFSKAQEALSELVRSVPSEKNYENIRSHISELQKDFKDSSEASYGEYSVGEKGVYYKVSLEGGAYRTPNCCVVCTAKYNLYDVELEDEYTSSWSEDTGHKTRKIHTQTQTIHVKLRVCKSHISIWEEYAKVFFNGHRIDVLFRNRKFAEIFAEANDTTAERTSELGLIGNKSLKVLKRIGNGIISLL
ncbi:MAG: hypothetical protein IJ831_05605 [Spirochaetales bacterium]|nr:hypothetical protein [Spirochaetales bacterium]